MNTSTTIADPGTDLTALAAQINEAHAACESALRDSLRHALEAGRLLRIAKQQAGHGAWGGWLENHFAGSARTARAYLRVAEHWPAIESKWQSSADLSIDQALKLIAEPRATAEPKGRDAAPAFRLPPLEPGHKYTMLGNRFDMIELTPSIDHPGFSFVGHYQHLDTDNASVVFLGRPVANSAIADVLRLQKFSPAFPDAEWTSESGITGPPHYATDPRVPAPAH